MSATFRQIALAAKGEILQFRAEHLVEQLLTDSRVAVFSETALFFAISGKMHDGHRFLNDLYKKGVRQFVVQNEKLVDLALLPEANVLLVPNTVAALQHIAAWHRHLFSIPTIGITGSNAKTIIKEWLFQLLSPDFSIVKSPKSYNSQIGVPLSVWQMRHEHTLAIFEAGISQMGEMENLVTIISPTIGIFTNIGPAHAEGFPSLKEKIAQKAKLFSTAEKIIYCKDHILVAAHLEENFESQKLVSWGNSEAAKYKIVIEKEGISVSGKTFQIPFRDAASIENLLHCVVLMLELRIGHQQIQNRILGLANIPMRLELKAGRHNCYLIDDTYNNDPEGLKIALQFMQQQDMKRRKVVILSDMLETGLSSHVLYKQVAALLNEKNIDQMIAVGAEMGSHRNLFQPNTLFFQNTETLLAQLPSLHLHDSLVLVKGARVFRFERVVQVLAQKIHRTVLEINLNALAHNLNVFRQMLNPSTKMMVMVKAFAYGSGSHEIAHLLQYHNVDYLAVAYTDEAIELRENNITLPIMVMNPSPDEFDKMAEYHLEPELYSMQVLRSYIGYLSSINNEVGASNDLTINHQPSTVNQVHLAIDTGMHRLGFEENQIDELVDLLKKSNVKVASVFSHLVGSDEAKHDDFSNKQAEMFERIASKIENALGYKVIKHLLNSAGIARLSRFQYDMVRLGIGLYGIETEYHPKDKHLQNVGTLKTVISQTREVKKGDSVGYSRKGVASKDCRVATLAIGYADGYSRAFSNGVGKVWIKGKLAPIIGNVCMDMCMVDVTGIEVEEGDEVIIFGEALPVTQVAQWANTISYELLTNVSERVKRVFYLD